MRNLKEDLKMVKDVRITANQMTFLIGKQGKTEPMMLVGESVNGVHARPYGFTCILLSPERYDKVMQIIGEQQGESLDEDYVKPIDWWTTQARANVQDRITKNGHSRRPNPDEVETEKRTLLRSAGFEIIWG